MNVYCKKDETPVNAGVFGCGRIEEFTDARIDGLVRTGQPLSRLQMDLFLLQNVAYLLWDYRRELV